MKYNLLVFIGRFQPLHLGHQEVIERALSLADKVLVLVGSSGQARSTRNPFTYEERAALIKQIYPNVLTAPLHDHTYNDAAWIEEVQQRVKHVISMGGASTNAEPRQKIEKIGLIGCNKDHTSFYLKMFPDWGSESVSFNVPLSSTHIRKALFEESMPERWFEAAVLNLKVYDWIQQFKKTNEFIKLRDTHQYLKDYVKKYGEGPHLTADALVQVGGKILVIKRGKEYGHGLLALPGGFVNKNERFLEAMLRELREETNLRVPVPVLKGSIKSSKIFDDPHRSERGRLVTECFHINLTNDHKLPEVRGGDDADEALWLSLADLKREHFFEDHYHIIRNMLGLN